MSVSKKSSGAGEKVSWVGFVNIDLTSAHKKQIKDKNMLSFEAAMRAIAGLLDDGYKVGFAWDDYSQCYQVSLTGTRSDIPNAGYTMSSRHTDLMVAISSLMFKHDVLCERGQWSESGYLNGSFDW